MNTVGCPHCGAVLSTGATYCAHCGRRATDFILCTECREPVASEARYCPHCTQRIRRAARLTDAPEFTPDLTIRATRLGALLAGGSMSISGFFRPPIVHVSGDRVRVTRWTLLGLRRDEQEVQFSRIASVRHIKGVFWSGIVVETFGGASDDLAQRGLIHDEAKRLADLLKAVAGA